MAAPMKTNEAQVHELVLDLTNPEKVGYCFRAEHVLSDQSI